MESIRKQGLLRLGRGFVHLSPDERTAISVGKRHGRPVVLAVQARCRYQVGFTFYRSEGGIWLTEAVPPDYSLFSRHAVS